MNQHSQQVEQGAVITYQRRNKQYSQQHGQLSVNSSSFEVGWKQEQDPSSFAGKAVVPKNRRKGRKKNSRVIVRSKNAKDEEYRLRLERLWEKMRKEKEELDQIELVEESPSPYYKPKFESTSPDMQLLFQVRRNLGMIQESQEEKKHSKRQNNQQQEINNSDARYNSSWKNSVDSIQQNFQQKLQFDSDSARLEGGVQQRNFQSSQFQHGQENQEISTREFNLNFQLSENPVFGCSDNNSGQQPSFSREIQGDENISNNFINNLPASSVFSSLNSQKVVSQDNLQNSNNNMKNLNNSNQQFNNNTSQILQQQQQQQLFLGKNGLPGIHNHEIYSVPEDGSNNIQELGSSSLQVRQQKIQEQVEYFCKTPLKNIKQVGNSEQQLLTPSQVISKTKDQQNRLAEILALYSNEKENSNFPILEQLLLLSDQVNDANQIPIMDDWLEWRQQSFEQCNNLSYKFQNSVNINVPNNQQFQNEMQKQQFQNNSIKSVVKKVGEGSFADVYRVGDQQVIKIIPFDSMEGRDLMTEVLIALTLTNLENPGPYQVCHFIRCVGVNVVKGPYSEQIFGAWKEYQKTQGSENEEPSMDKKLYVVLVFEYGGEDLESFHVRDFVEARAILFQTCMALAVAERSHNFEHRDLHFGNVLIQRVEPNSTGHYFFDGMPQTYRKHGIHVNLIDFTLSRLRVGQSVVCYNMACDPDLFKGPKGDTQFDTYRRMEKEFKALSWADFVPKTNCLWMYYLADLFDMKDCRAQNSQHHSKARKVIQMSKEEKIQLRNFRNACLKLENCQDLLGHQFFDGCKLEQI